MHRVVIVGCPGAGKSSAARKLASITGLPLIHLDRHYWLPGWERPEHETWRAKVQELVEHPRWIMDGNYSGTLDVRLPVADTLVHLDFSTFVCASRVVRRMLANPACARNDLADGCAERFDWPFLRFVLNYRQKHRERDLKKLSMFTGTRRRFTSPRQLAEFFAKLEQMNVAQTTITR
jgi:adenylate kinase family enzyme